MAAAAAMATSVANLSSCSCASSIAACSQQRLSSASTLRASPVLFSHHHISASPNVESYSLTVLCGRGDKRTRKGKIFKKSFGNTRPRKGRANLGLPLTPLPPSEPKPKEYDDVDDVILEEDEGLELTLT